MRYSRLTPLLALLLLPASLLAQAGNKIGVVDYSRAVVESLAGQEAGQKLQTVVQERQREMEQLQADFMAAQERYNTQQSALSATARSQRQAELRQMQLNIGRREEDINEELTLLQQNLLGPISEMVGQVVINYASEQGYALILDVSTADSPVVYFSDVANVTTEIMRRMDAMYEPPAGASEPETGAEAESEAESEPQLPGPGEESPEP